MLQWILAYCKFYDLHEAFFEIERSINNNGMIFVFFIFVETAEIISCFRLFSALITGGARAVGKTAESVLLYMAPWWFGGPPHGVVSLTPHRLGCSSWATTRVAITDTLPVDCQSDDLCTVRMQQQQRSRQRQRQKSSKKSITPLPWASKRDENISWNVMCKQ